MRHQSPLGALPAWGSIPAPRTTSAVLALQARGITKYFPPTVATSGIDLALAEGAVHVLVGEHGAGKSTMIKILCGIERPTAGTVMIAGEPVEIRTPSVATTHGIGHIPQHSLLCGDFTVLENVVLQGETTSGFDVQAHAEMIRTLASAKPRKRLMELMDAYDLNLHLDALVEDLETVDRLRVEILRALYHGSMILMVDEPTHNLTARDSDALIAHLRRLAATGLTLLVATTSPDTALALADTITVLRQGTAITTMDAHTTTPQHLADLIVGSGRPPLPPQPPVLQIEPPPGSADTDPPHLNKGRATTRGGVIYLAHPHESTQDAPKAAPGIGGVTPLPLPAQRPTRIQPARRGHPKTLSAKRAALRLRALPEPAAEDPGQ